MIETEDKNGVDNPIHDVNEELQWIPYRHEVEELPKPFGILNQDVVSVIVPTLKYPLEIKINVWEKIWYVADKAGKDIILVAKYIGIILAIIAVLEVLDKIKTLITIKKLGESMLKGVKNWRTTTVGIIGGIVLVINSLTGLNIDPSLIAAAAVALIGIFAKDGAIGSQP